MKELKFLYCEKCKKLELQVIGTKAPTICCGQPMKVLEANTTDAAGEKHVPVAEIVGNEVKVTVGSVIHPMLEEHHISFIAVVYEDGSYAIKDLDTQANLWLCFQSEQQNQWQHTNSATFMVCGKQKYNLPKTLLDKQEGFLFFLNKFLSL